MDEDAMIAALATAEAEVERLRAENDEQKRLLLDETYRPEGGEIVMRELAKVKAERDELRAAQAEHDLLTVSGVEDLANKLARTEDEVERLTAERDALSARLQAVRDLHFARGRNILGQPVCNECSPLQPMPCPTIRALDASLGTPGDEKPQASEPELETRIEYGHPTEHGWIPESRGIKYATHQRTVHFRLDEPVPIDHWTYADHRHPVEGCTHDRHDLTTGVRQHRQGSPVESSGSAE